MEAMSVSGRVAFESLRYPQQNYLVSSCICEPEIQERDLRGDPLVGWQREARACVLRTQKRGRFCAGLRN